MSTTKTRQEILDQQLEIVAELQAGLIDTIRGDEWIEKLPVVSSALTVAFDYYLRLLQLAQEVNG